MSMSVPWTCPHCASSDYSVSASSCPCCFERRRRALACPTAWDHIMVGRVREPRPRRTPTIKTPKLGKTAWEHILDAEE